jgi:hypothetical protein
VPVLLVQGRNDQAIAEMKVRLPIDRVVLIAPGHMPYRHPGHADGREAGGSGMEPVFHVVPLAPAMTQPQLVDGLDRVSRQLGGVTRAWRFDRMATVCHPESGRVTASFAGSAGNA